MFVPEGVFRILEKETAVGAVVTVRKAGAVFAEAFPSRCGNHQEEGAEGYLVDFQQRRQFPQRVPPAVCERSNVLKKCCVGAKSAMLDIGLKCERRL